MFHLHLEQIQNNLVSQAFQEGFIDGIVVAIDATHIEAQLPLDFKTIEAQIPQVPHWGIKKNSEGKNLTKEDVLEIIEKMESIYPEGNPVPLSLS